MGCSEPLVVTITGPQELYEVRPRKDKRGVDLISDALPFGRLWRDTPDNAIGLCSALQPVTRRPDSRLR